MALTPPHSSLSPLCHPDPLFPRAWLLFLLFELPDGDVIREATAPAPVFPLHLFCQPSIRSGPVFSVPMLRGPEQRRPGLNPVP